MKRNLFIIAISIVTMLSITGCKSDVQKAAEDYYSTVYLPKIQAEYGNESVVEGKIIVPKGNKRKVYLKDELESDISIKTLLLSFRKCNLDKAIAKKVYLNQQSFSPDGTDSIEIMKRQIVEDSILLDSLNTRLVQARKTKEISHYEYYCTELLTVNGKEIRNVIIMSIDPKNNVLDMEPKR